METPLRVLIVEDSEDDAILVIRELKCGGYKPVFERVDTATAMQNTLEQNTWDIIIADYAMPQFSGLIALELLNKTGLDLPFLIVSGTIGEDIAVEAMKAGAHDYIMKDNLKRLVPAIRRELREAEERRARRRAEETIHHLAFHDALTGLANRREFEHRLAELLENAKAQNTQHALLYMDLDRFKLVNDTCGHVAGDVLLQALTSLLQDRMRESDTLARLGGDEFGILLVNCPLRQAERIAGDLLAAIRNFRFEWQEIIFEVGASIGVIPIAMDSKDPASVLSRADVCCYAAKDMGRNRVHVCAEGDIELARHHGEMQWVSRITQALKEERFLLYRQTIMALGVHGAEGQHQELLLRLQDKNGDLILPGTFIPAAERYNLMPTLDRWVIRTAISSIASRHYSNKDCFAINLSGASLNDEDMLGFIHDQFQEYGLPPQMICFEITETAAISNLGKAAYFIQALRDLGCRFALDDFGRGMSSFAYLKNLSVDFLKIDGNFIMGMMDDTIDCAIIESINHIGHVMGIQTVAECVEDQTILQRLKEIGVDYAQGYCIDKPTPLYEKQKGKASKA